MDLFCSDAQHIEFMFRCWRHRTRDRLMITTWSLSIAQVFLAVLADILPLHLRPASAECSHQFLALPYANNTSQIANDTYSLLEDTKKCDDLLRKELKQQQIRGGLISACPDGLFSLDIAPSSVFSEGRNILPYVQMNVSITALVPLDELFFHFYCLYAPTTADYLCHNHGIQLAKWGQMIWPCRHLRVYQHNERDGEKPQSGTKQFHFSYTCFHLFGLSQYTLDLFVRHRGELCRRSLLLTIPLERQLDPRIAHFYAGHRWDEETALRRSHSDWSPLIWLDISRNDSVPVTLRPVNWLRPPRQLTLSIFAQESADRLHNGTELVKHRLLLTQRLQSEVDEVVGVPQFRWIWRDVDAGNYTLYAYVESGDCVLSCAATADSDQCKPCAHTALNFSLDVPKHSPEWRRTRLLIGIAKHCAIGGFVLLVLLFVALLVAFLYIRVWRPRAIARLPPRAMELRERPSVLVLYTDDCQAHSDAVLALCRTLEEGANASCVVDQWEFERDPLLRPSVWLTQKLVECDFVLAIFSEGSKRVLVGERMAPRRPFPDHFNTAIGHVIARINEIASSEGVTLLAQQNGHTARQRQKRAKSEPTMAQSFAEQPPATPSGGSPRPDSATPPATAPLTPPPADYNKSLLHRFVFARLVYSPPSCVPAFFASTQFGIGGPLELPGQIGTLIGRLHGLHCPLARNGGRTASEDSFLHQADLGALNAAILAFRQFSEENPNWIQERFEAEAEARRADEDGEVDQVEGALLAAQKRVPTAVEQTELAERYALLVADEGECERSSESDGEEKGKQRIGSRPPKQYELVHGDDDSHSSS